VQNGATAGLDDETSRTATGACRKYSILEAVGAYARFSSKRFVHRRSFQPDKIDLGAVDGCGKRVVLHARAAAQVAKHHDRGSHRLRAFHLMTLYLTLAFAGMALGLVLTPLVSKGSAMLGLVDAPGGRKVHSVSVPRLGGLAIASAAALALLAAALGHRSAQVPQAMASVSPILIGGGLVFVVGLLDDVRPLSPWPKLIVQVAGAFIVMQAGLRIERITIAGGSWQLGLSSWPVTLVWIVGLTNAFNLIDGVDGLAAGIATIAGTTCAVILIARGHVAEAMLLAALVGAAIGFLVFNFPPASIFLGDSGSLLFGFVLATTAITGWQKGATALAAGIPILMFALPIADAATTLVRRVLRGGATRSVSLSTLAARIVEPDRHHIHHRLLALGFSTRGTVLLLYGITIVLSAVALATAQLD